MTTRTVGNGVTSSGVILGSGDIEYVNAGGRAVSTTVNSGGLLDARSGGALSGTTVDTGGSVTVEAGGSGTYTVVNAGGSETVGGVVVSSTITGARAVEDVGTGGSTYYAPAS